METETILALIFVIVGVLMMLAEAGSPGNFLLVPATVLLGLGVLGMLFPGFLLSWWSPLAAVAFLVPATYVTIKLYQRLAPTAPPETTVATSLVGMHGVVTKKVSTHNLRGKVKIANDIWSATSCKDISEGTKVIVKSSEGVHVYVEEEGEGECLVK